jgi:hypothetical protein
MLHLFLWVLALVCFILAAIAVPSGRYGLGWAGLACIALDHLLGIGPLV